MTSVEKVHENKMRRYAERQGYMLTKSPRRDPRARGYGSFVLVRDGRRGPGDPKDAAAIEAAHVQMDRGQGLTMDEVEELLGYGEND